MFFVYSKVRIKEKTHYLLLITGLILLSPYITSNRISLIATQNFVHPLEHGLCWVHAERLINKLIPLNDLHLDEIEQVQDQIWQFYQQLKDDKNLTTKQQREQLTRLETRFDEIFSQSTDFEPLKQVLGRLKRRKRELLKVLEKPDLPLQNNAGQTRHQGICQKKKN